MLRKVHLHGRLKKTAGREVFDFDCDDQSMLLAAIRNLSPEVDLALREVSKVKIIASDSNAKKAEPVDGGFTFGDNVTDLHIIPHVVGDYSAAAMAIWEQVAIYVAVAVATSYVSAMLAPKMPSGSNGAGGLKSIMFNGPINSTDQGGPIPVVYGKKVLIGSTVIAVDIDYFRVA